MYDGYFLFLLSIYSDDPDGDLLIGYTDYLNVAEYRYLINM